MILLLIAQPDSYEIMASKSV